MLEVYSAFGRWQNIGRVQPPGKKLGPWATPLLEPLGSHVLCVLGMVQEGTFVHMCGSQRTTFTGVPQEVPTLILETGSLIWSDTYQIRLGWLVRLL